MYVPETFKEELHTITYLCWYQEYSTVQHGQKVFLFHPHIVQAGLGVGWTGYVGLDGGLKKGSPVVFALLSRCGCLPLTINITLAHCVLICCSILCWASTQLCQLEALTLIIFSLRSQFMYAF